VAEGDPEGARTSQSFQPAEESPQVWRFQFAEGGEGGAALVLGGRGGGGFGSGWGGGPGLFP